MIRVLVVDDSLTVRMYLAEVLSFEPDFAVVGQACDGLEAIELCRKLRPDVITMDMAMPHMNGLEATSFLMAHCPTPILIVSSSHNRQEIFNTCDAMAAGAVEAMDKPRPNESHGAWRKRFLENVRVVSRIRVIPRPQLARASKSSQARPSWRTPRLVAIGASTGGPAALVKILKALPREFPLPVLLVNHMEDSFGSMFVDWLASHSILPVAEALDGDLLPPIGQGGVLVARPGVHMVVERNRLRYTISAERYGCRPSVDVLFESVAAELGDQAIACLLTGMGKDGAAGLLAIRKRGGFTLAQDEASSTVFGMPREAIALEAAQLVLPLSEIADTLNRLANQAGRQP